MFTEFFRQQVVNNRILLKTQTCKAKYPREYEWVMQQFPEYSSYRDKVCAVATGGHKRCKVCGKIISFYPERMFCSSSCYGKSERMKEVTALMTSEEAKQKARETSIRKYGVEHFSQLPESRKKSRRNFDHIAPRYGKDNPLAKGSAARKKRKQTMINRYGSEHALCNSEIVQRAVNSANTTREAKKRKLLDSIMPGLQPLMPIGRHGKFVDTEMILMACGKIDPNVETIRRNYVNWRHHAKAYGIKAPKSYFEQQVMHFLDELNVDYITSSRSVIFPKELDFYLPNHNLAIECNGVYWHDSFRKKENKTHHIKKKIMCENKGINLLHIWETDWEYKKDIVKSIILSKLGMTERVYAKNCKVDIVENRTADDFFNSCHLKGSGKSGITYGLWHNGELIMCMRFARHKEYQWELLRMASRLNTTVVGGMSKLLKAFMKDNEATSIMSYVDRDISDGKSYYACGFNLVSKTAPSYWYVHKRNNTVHSRQSMSKSKLTHFSTYNEKLSEEDIILLSDEYYRIHNSGNLKMVYTIKHQELERSNETS